MSPSGKKITIGLGVAFAALGTWWAFRKKSAIQNLKVDVKNLKVAFKNTAIQTTMNLLVTNPSNEVLQFLNFTGTVYTDSQPLGTIDISKPVTVAANKTTPVPIATVFPMNNIVNTILSLITTKKIPTAGILKGTVTLSGGIVLPVYYQFPFSNPTTK